MDERTYIERIWPEWHIEGERIGRGSFGEVYRAVRREENIISYAAVKILSIPRDRDELESLMSSEGYDEASSQTYYDKVKNECVREIELMVSLRSHTNVVRIEDYKVVPKGIGEIGWNIYIHMELLTPLSSYYHLSPGQSAPEAEVMKLGRDICSALQECETRRLIHRDIKPENIFVNEYGVYKLGDFGIARSLEHMTSGLSSKGTPNYMAPEVYHGQKYDNRADLYSLGIVMYRLLNGNRFPFLFTQEMALDHDEKIRALERRRNGEALPPPCDASPGMKKIILKACDYHPERRFRTAADMKQALSSEKDPDRTMILTDGTGQAPSEKRKKKPLAWILAAAAVLVAGVLAFSLGKGSADPSGQSPELPENAVVSSAKATELSIRQMPQKVSYFVGESFVPDGLLLKVVYEDGETDFVEEGYTCTETVFASAGAQSVEIRYAGLTVPVEVDVQSVEVESLGIAQNPDRTSFFVGEKTDLSGLVLKATYNDRSTKNVTSGFTCTPSTLSTPGEQKITVTYGGETTSFVVNVRDIALTQLALKSNPTKTSYFVGDSLNTAGLVLTASYNNGTSQDITGGFTCTPTKFSTAGSQTVTVSYGGKSVSFTANVTAVTLTSLTVKTNPAKTSYFAGQSLDTAGLTLTAKYSNGGTQTVQSGFTCSPTQLSAAGTQTVTVSYGGKSASFTVTVKKAVASLIDLSVKTSPTKTFYIVGETLDTTGLALTAKYSDGTTKTITSGFSCSPTRFDLTGNKTVTVSYEEDTTFTTFFNVIIRENVAASGKLETGLSWSLNKGILTVFGKGEIPAFPSYIPSNQKNPWYSYRHDIIEVIIEDGVTQIGSGAFHNFTYMEKITLPESVASLGRLWIYGANIRRIYIPAGLVKWDEPGYLWCNSLEEFIVADDNPSYKSIDGILYSKDGKELLSYPPAKEGKTFIVPETVEKLSGNQIFRETELEKIVIPPNIQYIEEAAFFETGSGTTIIFEGLGSAPKSWNPRWNDGCGANLVWNP